MDLQRPCRGPPRWRGWVLPLGLAIALVGGPAWSEECPGVGGLQVGRQGGRAADPLADRPGMPPGELDVRDLSGRQEATLPTAFEDWLAGRRLQEAGRLEEALQRFLSVLGQPVEDDARLRAGAILVHLGDLARARAILWGISPVSRRWAEARILLAEVLAQEGRPAGAVSWLRDVSREDCPVTLRARAVRLWTEAWAAQGRRDEALSLARRAWIEMPEREAEAELRQALTGLGAPPGPLDQAIRDFLKASPARVRDLARMARRRPRSLTSLDPAWPLLVQGQAARLGPAGSARALQWFTRAAKEARDPRVRALALLEAGDLLVSRGRDREAMDRYAAAVRADPGGGVEGTAWFSLARCAFRVGDHETGHQALDRLEALESLAVPSSQVAWERVRGLLIQGRLAEALARMDQALRRRGPGDGLVGRDLERWTYYRGVVRIALEDREGALEDLSRVAANAPHTWYGLLAHARLGAFRGFPTPVRWPRRTTCRDSEAPFWWWAAGSEAEAVAELEARLNAGLIHPDARKALVRMLSSSPSPRTRARARRLLGPSRPVPAELYPMPYSQEVAKAASESGLPRSLLWAVARVESGFQPQARSPRGARGLMQLLAPVARRVARMGLGDPALARRWTTPGVNLRLGAAYLAALVRHFRGSLPLALVAYHAGPGAARRFVARMGHLPLDLFVDSLPYPDTIRYVQSVLALDGGYRQQIGEEAWVVVPGEPPPPDPGPFRWAVGGGLDSGNARPEGPSPVLPASSPGPPTGRPGAPGPGLAGSPEAE